MPTLKVASRSNPNSVAGAIASEIRKGEQVVLVAIGRDAVNQMVKAIVMARRYLTPENVAIACQPDMETLSVTEGKPEETKMVVSFKVYTCDP